MAPIRHISLLALSALLVAPARADVQTNLEGEAQLYRAAAKRYSDQAQSEEDNAKKAGDGTYKEKTAEQWRQAAEQSRQLGFENFRKAMGAEAAAYEHSRGAAADARIDGIASDLSSSGGRNGGLATDGRQLLGDSITAVRDGRASPGPSLHKDLTRLESTFRNNPDSDGYTSINSPNAPQLESRFPSTYGEIANTVNNSPQMTPWVRQQMKDGLGLLAARDENGGVLPYRGSTFDGQVVDLSNPNSGNSRPGNVQHYFGNQDGGHYWDNGGGAGGTAVRPVSMRDYQGDGTFTPPGTREVANNPHSWYGYPDDAWRQGFSPEVVQAADLNAAQADVARTSIWNSRFKMDGDPTRYAISDTLRGELNQLTHYQGGYPATPTGDLLLTSVAIAGPGNQPVLNSLSPASVLELNRIWGMH